MENFDSFLLHIASKYQGECEMIARRTLSVEQIAKAIILAEKGGRKAKYLSAIRGISTPSEASKNFVSDLKMGLIPA